VTRVFAFADIAIGVHAADESHLRWLTEFLEPHFKASSTTVPPVCQIRVVEDARQYAAAVAAGAGVGAVDAFALDAGPLSLPRWRGAQGRLFDARRRLFYEIAGPALTVTIVSAPANREVRSALFGVLREVASNHTQRAGALLLHASAFAVGRRGVVVAGPKKAGKTTLLVHALRAGSHEYVSNDRISVTPGLSPRALGVPTVVRLRRRTLELFPAVAAGLAAWEWDYRLMPGEVAGCPGPTPASPSGARRVSHAHLCRVLGVRARAECEIGALVFPRITEEPGGFAVRRLVPAEVGAELERALFGVRPGRSTSDAFVLPGDPPAPDRAALAARCRSLADRVPGFECRLGIHAYDPPHAAADLMAAVLAE
jgi:hypothetical protein